MTIYYTEEDVRELERLWALTNPDRPNVKELLEHHIFSIKAQLPKGLRYNEVQWKAAHNSVERDENIFQQLDPADGKCGAIELGFVVDPASVNTVNTKEEIEKRGEGEGEGEKEREKYKGWRFAVQQDDTYNSSNAPVHEVLKSLNKWSAAHPGHHIITITLNLHSGGAYHGAHDQFVLQIDHAVLWGLGREKVFTPGDLQRDSPTLLAGVLKYGWPTLKELQNKFMLVISGADSDPPVRERRNIYSTTNPSQRLCFVDMDQRGCNPKQQNCDINHAHYQLGDRVFVNIQLGNNNWRQLGRDAHASGFIGRVYTANKKEEWDEARKARIHFIATDKIRNHKWAALNDTGCNFEPLI